MRSLYIIAFCFLLIQPAMSQKQTQIIAHRGAWKEYALPENSIASLQKAIELKCYGSEFDVRRTKDGVLVVNHDPVYYGDTIELQNYADLNKNKLSNGENLPTLESYFSTGTRDNPPTLLVALSQSAGRGRMGRAWQSQPGAGLTFSWGMHLAPTDWSGLSLAVGLALVEALDPDGQWGLQLKWPNDLCWQSAGAVRKLGGILIETQMAAASAETPARRWCVVGVGLNLRTPQINTPGLAPVGWSALTGAAAPHGPDILQACMAALVPAMRAFELHGFA